MTFIKAVIPKKIALNMIGLKSNMGKDVRLISPIKKERINANAATIPQILKLITFPFLNHF